MSDVAVTNLLHELVAVNGVSDTVFNLTGTAARLADTLTLNSGAEVVQMQVEGGNARYRDDGTAPTTAAGFLIPQYTILFVAASAFGNLRFVGSGTDTPTLRVTQKQYVTSSVRRSADLSVSMRSIKFIDLLDHILATLELGDFTTWIASATTGEKRNITHTVNRHLRRAWEARFWPDLTVLQERDVDATGDHPVIPFAQSGEVNIGLVQDVHTANPFLADSGAATIGFTLTNSGVSFPGGTDEDSLWIRHLLRVPEFTLTAWDSGTAYTAGQVAYLASTGECYECIVSNTNQTPTNTAYWTIQRIPHFLYDATHAAACGDLMASRKPEASEYWQGTSEKLLYRLIQQLPMQTQGSSAAVRVA